MKTFEIKATDLVEYIVTLQAESEEEALERFLHGDYTVREVQEVDRWLYDGGETAEEVSK